LIKKEGTGGRWKKMKKQGSGGGGKKNLKRAHSPEHQEKKPTSAPRKKKMLTRKRNLSSGKLVHAKPGDRGKEKNQ